MGSELREVFNYHLLKLTEHGILKRIYNRWPDTSRHGCQMARAKLLDCVWPFWLEGLLLCYATLQNLIPSSPWIAPPSTQSWRNPRKGRDQMLPSGNTASRNEDFGIAEAATLGFENLLFPFSALAVGMTAAVVLAAFEAMQKRL